MSKKLISLALAALMALSLAACGSSAPKESEEPAFTADLAQFYSTLFGDDGPAMAELEGEMLDSFYPGLSDIELKQQVIYTPMISAVAAEVALVEVAKAEDVEAVKAIFQQRIDDQVAGGAWYPATIEVWENNSEIVVIDNYVCLFVGEGKDAQVEAFRALGESK